MSDRERLMAFSPWSSLCFHTLRDCLDRTSPETADETLQTRDYTVFGTFGSLHLTPNTVARSNEKRTEVLG